YPTSTERCGKWIIFLSEPYIDELWQLIRTATEQGELGHEAKASSAGRIRARGEKMYMICVYTYDFQDKEDVMRVREMLREKGIKRPINYKSDEDTVAGKYAKFGDKNI